MDPIGSMKSSWILGRTVRSCTTAYACGGMYYGEDLKLKINGKEEPLSHREYGRGSARFLAEQ